MGGAHKTEQLKRLVTKPLNIYSKLLGKDGALEVHNSTHYHKNAAQCAIDFKITYSNPNREVINMLDSQRKKEVDENRARLRPIIETIIFLGRQNIALRGHRDDGKVSLDEFPIDNDKSEDKSVINQGNFKQLLKFRVASGDHLLKNHLKTSTARATYISGFTQNEIIDCCSKDILNKICSEAKEAKQFSVIFDETTDISNISQLSLTIRYIFKNQVNEKFLGFINCHDYIFEKNKDTFLKDNEESNDLISEIQEPKITGKILGNAVVQLLQDFDFNLDNCVGVGTDGCSVMVSSANGAVQQIQQFAKNAVHSPCSNHALNLCISKSSNIQLIRNCVGVIKETISFFNLSAKRNFVLKKYLTGHKSLSSLCETRWVERHDSVMEFKNSLVNIVETLTEISQWNDITSSAKAKMLISALCTCDFILSLNSLSQILSVTYPISKILQKRDEDVVTASTHINCVIDVLQKYRSSCEDKFKSLFEESKLVFEKLDVEMKLPRLVGRQTHRGSINSGSKDPLDYYRINMYIPLLEGILEDLKYRFLSKENENIVTLMLLIPSCMIKIKYEETCTTFKKIIQVITCYSFFEHVPEERINGELGLWYAKWSKQETEGKNICKNALDALDECHHDVFPILHEVLCIICSLPISVASAERTFSTLRRKTC
ncbi:zinc finger MYM-type protein 1-like [Myzus persicae]|uniref:zinc finger MYM-type protein 1-like n=1 Tax=Myzus persicae TaxID=13164 RepID=UPI000B932015|nr:zinc finger MYM-type protein 1-like [Myzus persicae]